MRPAPTTRSPITTSFRRNNGFPDYAHPTYIDSSTFTAPKNGWILYHGHGVVVGPTGCEETQYAYTHVAVNGTNVAHHHHSTPNAVKLNTQEQTIFPVRKGDTASVTIVVGSYFWYFMPMRA